jgi:hypothetical protein
MTMSDLVSRLSTGQHPVTVSLRPERTTDALKASIDRGHVLIRFTGTCGGTELGVPVDRQRTNLSAADFEHGRGSLTIVGDLTLDFVPVSCVAEIQLPLMEGVGRIERRALAMPEAAS